MTIEQAVANKMMEIIFFIKLFLISFKFNYSKSNKTFLMVRDDMLWNKKTGRTDKTAGLQKAPCLNHIEQGLSLILNNLFRYGLSFIISVR